MIAGTTGMTIAGIMMTIMGGMAPIGMTVITTTTATTNGIATVDPALQQPLLSPRSRAFFCCSLRHAYRNIPIPFVFSFS